MSDPAPLTHTQERSRTDAGPRARTGSAPGDLPPLLALQATAGNQAVAELVASSSIDAMPFLQRAPVAAPPHHAAHAAAAPPPQPGETVYHLTIGTDDRANLTRAEALKMLHRHLTRVQGWTEYQVIEYREGSISGAERSVTALKVAVAAGAVAATIATGGTAAAAGAGVLGTAGAVAVGAGVYGEFSEMGTQGGEMISGQRQAGMFDPVAILKRAGTDAAVAFVTAYLGGSLSKVLVRSFGQYLISSMGEEAAAALAQEIGVAGKLTPELVVSNGQKFILEFFANTALTPLTTAIQAAVDTLKGG